MYFSCSRGINDVDIEEECVHISAKAAAPLILYCEKEVLEVRRNDIPIPWEYDKDRKILSLDNRTQVVNSPSMYMIMFEN